MKIKKNPIFNCINTNVFLSRKEQLKKITVRLFSSTDIVFSCSYYQFLNLFFLTQKL